MSPLRILMFTTFYPPYSFGGDAVGVERMARALASRGHLVTVVHDQDAYFSLGGVEPAAATQKDNIHVIGLRSRLGMLSNLATQQLGRPVVHLRRLKDIVRTGGFDIIWYNNTSLVGGPGLLGIGEALKVYEAHEHWLVCPTHVLWRHKRELCTGRECLRCTLNYRRPPQIWRATGALDRALDHIDVLIAKSEFSREKHREFGLRQDMEVLPYFLPDIDMESVQPYSGNDRPYFMFAGRLEQIKGLQDVFPAMDVVDGVDLLIVGDGDYAGELKRLARENPRIRFVGRKSTDELNAYYRGAIGLVVPSICYETFGLILIESFRVGTPVIARRLGPFPEIVGAAGGGSLFTTRSELITAMQDLRDNPQHRQRQSAAARAAFEKFWIEDRVFAAYSAAFARAAHRKGDARLARIFESGAFEFAKG